MFDWPLPVAGARHEFANRSCSVWCVAGLVWSASAALVGQSPFTQCATRGQHFVTDGHSPATTNRAISALPVSGDDARWSGLGIAAGELLCLGGG
jgi:hypothetical protein